METTEANLDVVFAALADATRRAMIARLALGPATIGELAAPFADIMSMPAVTKHVAVLERAGLVHKTKDAQWRTCTLDGACLRAATDWLMAYRGMWEAKLDRLAAYLEQIGATSSPTTIAIPLTPSPATSRPSPNTAQPSRAPSARRKPKPPARQPSQGTNHVRKRKAK